MKGKLVRLTFCADQGAKLRDSEYVIRWIILPIELNCELHQNMKMKLVLHCDEMRVLCSEIQSTAVYRIHAIRLPVPNLRYFCAHRVRTVVD